MSSVVEGGRVTVVLDARCLQDPDYAGRGVGRHSSALLRHAPRHGAPGLHLVGLVDADMTPLADEFRGLFDATVPSAYAALLGRDGRGAAPPAAFVSLSPMTHDPLFTGRLLAGDAALVRAAVVYDFIPRREPARYLPGPAERLRYAASLRWLARHDLFAPISQAAADDLGSILGVPAGRIAVTGAPLDPAFEAPRGMDGAGRRHVLVVGGGDARKNPEVAIRAHARCAAAQRGAGVPLVVAGNYDAARAQAFRALAVEHGGRAELVEVPGHLPEAELVRRYGLARVLVAGSIDEGFSLPVVEGMAAGAPCLVSDIAAHRELVADPARRFAPHDDASLARMLAQALDDGDRGWRSAALREQDAVWPRFRAARVAERFWAQLLPALPVAQTIPAAPAVSRGARPRVALLSPLPPDRSGVADYTAATCAELGRLVDLHVFSETRDPAPIAGVSAMHGLSALPHLSPAFDRVISVVGNSHFHVRILESLRRYGAACVAHDARMMSFYAVLLGRERALSIASRELGRDVVDVELDAWFADEATLKALFLGELAESSAPMIVHSAVTARELRQRHGITPVHLPFSIYRAYAQEAVSPSVRATARARLAVAEGEVLIASFGFVHGTKAPEDCVWALDTLRGWSIPAVLHFVGGTEGLSDGGANLRGLAARLGLAAFVRFTDDYVSEATFQDYLIGADLAIQLRTYGLGGLSGALLDCAAAGLPTVANAGLADAVGVPGYVRTVPDALSPLLIAEALANLIDAGLTRRRPEAERRAFCADRAMRPYARRLCDALALDISGPLA